MSHEFENRAPPELKLVEQALASVAPAPLRIERDRLMFLAGQASALASGGREPPEALAASVGVAARNATEGVPYSARGLLWPAATAALAATSLGLAIVLLTRPSPPERIVYRDREVLVAGRPQSVGTSASAPHGTPQRALPTTLATSAPIPADNYVRTREVALRLGLDALGNRPNASGRETPAPTARSLLESLLPAEPGRSDPTTESSHM